MIDKEYFKAKLEKEKKILESELGTVGRRNPSNPADWEATEKEVDDNRPTDIDEVADEIEDYENNSAILQQLEVQLKDVNDALARIENGTYGICENLGEEIPHERLEANPSARTCLTHSK